MRNLNKIKSQFVFNKQQRIGVFLLLLVIVLLQFIYWRVDFNPDGYSDISKEELIAFQNEIDSINLANKKAQKVIRPFNPNFI